jgi:hypothetical protein
MLTSRHLVLAGAGLVGVSTAATSAVSLYELARLCGIPGPLAAALPIALDAGAAVAALVWITERGELRSWGRGIALAALVGTVLGNGVQHAIASGLLAVTLPLVLTVGATIPACLWAVVHLSALMVRPTVATRVAPSRPRSNAAAPTVGASTQKPAPRPTGGKRAAGLDWARDDLARTGRLPTGGAIALAAGVSRAEGDRIRARLKAEQEGAAS